MLRYAVVIPAFNEASFLPLMLESLANQSILPQQAILVDDHSTDQTYALAKEFSNKHDWFFVEKNKSEPKNIPGSKVIKAFQKGFDALHPDWDIIVKLDADLILPPNYFERIIAVFAEDITVGMVGGFASIEVNGKWVIEKLTDNDHIRGAFKAYRKTCFEAIGGLRQAMGWDTLDELLARYHQFKVVTIADLLVKHLKPTGASYTPASKYKQGAAFYTLGYGFTLTTLAAAKLAVMKRKPLLFFYYLLGYLRAMIKKTTKIVTADEATYIRSYRWQKIRGKLGFR